MRNIEREREKGSSREREREKGSSRERERERIIERERGRTIRETFDSKRVVRLIDNNDRQPVSICEYSTLSLKTRHPFPFSH